MRVNVVSAKQRSLKSLLPLPAADANKYTRGKLTVIGGSARYPGSACLAGAAAFRTGAGYVECLCAPETVPLIQGYMASLVARPWDAEAVRASLGAPVDEHHPQACLIGCGMEDDGAHQRALVEEALTTCAIPLILDGGGAEGGRPGFIENTPPGTRFERTVYGYDPTRRRSCSIGESRWDLRSRGGCAFGEPCCIRLSDRGCL